MGPPLRKWFSEFAICGEYFFLLRSREWENGEPKVLVSFLCQRKLLSLEYFVFPAVQPTDAWLAACLLKTPLCSDVAGTCVNVHESFRENSQFAFVMGIASGFC